MSILTFSGAKLSLFLSVDSTLENVELVMSFDRDEELPCVVNCKVKKRGGGWGSFSKLKELVS